MSLSDAHSQMADLLTKRGVPEAEAEGEEAEVEAQPEEAGVDEDEGGEAAGSADGEGEAQAESAAAEEPVRLSMVPRPVARQEPKAEPAAPAFDPEAFKASLLSEFEERLKGMLPQAAPEPEPERSWLEEVFGADEVPDLDPKLVEYIDGLREKAEGAVEKVSTIEQWRAEQERQAQVMAAEQQMDEELQDPRISKLGVHPDDIRAVWAQGEEYANMHAAEVAELIHGLVTKLKGPAPVEKPKARRKAPPGAKQVSSEPAGDTDEPVQRERGLSSAHKKMAQLLKSMGRKS